MLGPLGLPSCTYVVINKRMCPDSKWVKESKWKRQGPKIQPEARPSVYHPAPTKSRHSEHLGFTKQASKTTCHKELSPKACRPTDVMRGISRR